MAQITGLIYEEVSIMKCPECGNSVVPEGGCIYCPSCGWSPCNG
ncbi:hypothetical protein DOT_1570 [Desulfosporosinus sp. OT]|nr:hypothetical protein DOT_1570 [Desulfosporosinus sp. OT]